MYIYPYIGYGGFPEYLRRKIAEAARPPPQTNLPHRVAAIRRLEATG